MGKETRPPTGAHCAMMLYLAEVHRLHLVLHTLTCDARKIRNRKGLKKHGLSWSFDWHSRVAVLPEVIDVALVPECGAAAEAELGKLSIVDDYIGQTEKCTLQAPQGLNVLFTCGG